MSGAWEGPILETIKTRFREIVTKERMLEAKISVLVKTLKAEEAIGTPGRRDFPIIIGKERVVEAGIFESKGHAFTDSPRELVGTLGDVLSLDLSTNQNRAIFIATLNATLSHLGLVTATVHCKDDDPEKCALEIASTLLERYGRIKVGLVGLNPAIAERLTETFGPERVCITDLNPENIGQRRFGVEVWHGERRAKDLIDRSDVVVLTGTTLVNGTFDKIWEHIQKQRKRHLVYGVTAAGTGKLAGFDRICPCGRDG